MCVSSQGAIVEASQIDPAILSVQYNWSEEEVSVLVSQVRGRHVVRLYLEEERFLMASTPLPHAHIAFLLSCLQAYVLKRLFNESSSHLKT